MSPQQMIPDARASQFVFLYSNQPLCRCGGRYFGKMKNFVDFLGVLATQNENYYLVVPCREVNKDVADGLIPIDLPSKVIEVAYYEGHRQALFRTLTNAWKIRSHVKRYLSAGARVTMAGPGPNSMLFMLSWVLPRRVRFAFFIRGDTERTVHNMYRHSVLRFPATALVRLFQSRIFGLLSSGRAMAFTYGSELQRKYGSHGPAWSIAPLIDERALHVEGLASGSSSKEAGYYRVLFVGRLSREKGILELIEAAALGLVQGRPFQLAIVGHGALAENIESLIRDKGLQEWVTFVGYVPHGESLFKQYDSSDLLCLPSHTEGVPRVIIEAFARGLPVAATPVGSIPELFGDDLHLIENNTPEAILKAVDWCRRNRQMVSEKAARGRDVARCYTLEHFAGYVSDRLSQSTGTGA